MYVINVKNLVKQI